MEPNPSAGPDGLPLGIMQKKPLWCRFGVWAFGVLALAAVVLVVTRIGELEHFVDLMRRAASRLQ